MADERPKSIGTQTPEPAQRLEKKFCSAYRICHCSKSPMLAESGRSIGVTTGYVKAFLPANFGVKEAATNTRQECVAHASSCGLRPPEKMRAFD
jgi:hypothetical protein